jgi:hypothetical protein
LGESKLNKTIEGLFLVRGSRRRKSGGRGKKGVAKVVINLTLLAEHMCYPFLLITELELPILGIIHIVHMHAHA